MSGTCGKVEWKGNSLALQAQCCAWYYRGPVRRLLGCDLGGEWEGDGRWKVSVVNGLWRWVGGVKQRTVGDIPDSERADWIIGWLDLSDVVLRKKIDGAPEERKVKRIKSRAGDSLKEKCDFEPQSASAVRRLGPSAMAANAHPGWAWFMRCHHTRPLVRVMQRQENNNIENVRFPLFTLYPLSRVSQGERYRAGV